MKIFSFLTLNGYKFIQIFQSWMFLIRLLLIKIDFIIQIIRNIAKSVPTHYTHTMCELNWEIFVTRTSKKAFWIAVNDFY